MLESTPGSMVKEGYYFGVPLLLVGGVSYLLHWYVAAAVLVFLALFVFSFFRDPERVIPAEPGAVVSPGDGRVVVVTEEENAGRPGKRVSIFLAVWNVHVNRAPAAGTIAKLEYRPGKFLAAMRERASAENEQNVFTLSTDAGEMVFKQIAGLIARRVVSWKKTGEKVARGERIGLVRFGARVDLWVPKEAENLVRVASTLDPPFTCSPTLTKISASFGTHRSTRDPNRTSPMRSPRATFSPVFFQETTLRAISPAICLKTISPASVESVNTFCSFSTDARSRIAARNFPGRYSSFAMVPAAGARFTCTFHTAKKMLTRFPGLPAFSSSVTTTTRPSPGDTTAPGSAGITRSGSRKKEKTNNARNTRTAAATYQCSR